MMDNDLMISGDGESVAADFLISAALKIHRSNREDYDETDGDFVDFSDDEITAIVRSIWIGRFSTSRREFKDAVGQSVSRLVNP